MMTYMPGFTMDAITGVVKYNTILSSKHYRGIGREDLVLNSSCYDSTGLNQSKLSKAIYTINGVTVSFYSGQLGSGNCSAVHFADLASKLASDPNPIVLMLDTRRQSYDYISKYFEPNGLGLADAGMNKEYQAIVVIASKGHIRCTRSQIYYQSNSSSYYNYTISTLAIY